MLDDDINDAQWRGIVGKFDIADDCTPWSVDVDVLCEEGQPGYRVLDIYCSQRLLAFLHMDALSKKSKFFIQWLKPFQEQSTARSSDIYIYRWGLLAADAKGSGSSGSMSG